MALSCDPANHKKRVFMNLFEKIPYLSIFATKNAVFTNFCGKNAVLTSFRDKNNVFEMTKTQCLGLNLSVQCLINQ